MNVPLFVLGAKKLGRKFLFGSLSGMLLSSVFIDLFAFIPAPKTEILLDSLYGGILVGLGIGLVFLSGGSTGGSDIAARLLRRRFRSASLGKVMLAIDLFIITLTGIVFHDLSKTLYSALPLAASSFVMDQLLYGLDHSTVALIISEHYQTVSEQIGTPARPRRDRTGGQRQLYRQSPARADVRRAAEGAAGAEIHRA